MSRIDWTLFKVDLKNFKAIEITRTSIAIHVHLHASSRLQKH